MASKRFLIVPVDSSAASMPLPGATMATATLLRSARFMDASSSAFILAGQNRPFSGNSQAKLRRRKEGRAASGRGFPSRHFWVELALGVTLRHLGRRQHLLEDRKSTRLNSSHMSISYAVFCLKKKINRLTMY